jgi:hypothetical protein
MPLSVRNRYELELGLVWVETHCAEPGAPPPSPRRSLLVTWPRAAGIRSDASEKKTMSRQKPSVGPSVVPDSGSVPEPGQHAACVDAWLERSGKDLPPEVLLGLFEAALGALWRRTATTLGEVTLTAIAARVLYNASETFPLVSSLKVEPTGGISFRELRERISSVHGSELTEGMRFVLVEFLTVLGNLTAEILTPELHSGLSNVLLPDTKAADKTS